MVSTFLWKGLFFAGSTALLVFFSRRSLHHPRSHGFFRFFAWEVILILFLLNFESWFTQPFSWWQIISWVLLSTSFVPLFWGVALLKQRGNTLSQRQGEPGLLAFENTSTLVRTGIYRFIRHPLYSSLLLLTWGIFFKAPSWLGAALAAATSTLLFFTALADEKECIHFFGDEYVDYMKTTRRFIPFIF